MSDRCEMIHPTPCARRAQIANVTSTRTAGREDDRTIERTSRGEICTGQSSKNNGEHSIMASLRFAVAWLTICFSWVPFCCSCPLWTQRTIRYCLFTDRSIVSHSLKECDRVQAVPS